MDTSAKDYDLNLLSIERDMRIALQKKNYNEKHCQGSHRQIESLIFLYLYWKSAYSLNQDRKLDKDRTLPLNRETLLELRFQLSNVCSLLIKLTNCWRSVIVILKNIIKFRSPKKALPLFFSQNVSKFSEPSVINSFNLHFIFKFHKNGVQSDIAYTL